MRRLRLEGSFTVFLLFFGTAFIDALRRRGWLLAILYVALAAMFLFSGSRKRSLTG